MNKRVTVNKLVEMKQNGDKITMLTAYDYITSGLLDELGIDIILVGDSLGMVVLGYETTLPVTMEEMLHHTRAVARAAKRSMVVGDMPFMSYQISPEEALYNAGRFLKEADAQAIKLEGGEEICPMVSKMVEVGIPVMGHLGVTPQSVHQMGGYGVQGREEEAAKKMISDAKALEKTGAFSIVLEKIPSALAKKITKTIGIPTIGIGAGPHCDGQVLVTQDLLGMFEKFVPKFVKQYAKLSDDIRSAISSYIKEVKSGEFPGEEHSF
ncbi:MAG TPA: 3-methyl-2-oxobutanoate hydroxymethyltransferase [Actinobacteria bacterium]|nr:3-methyl-2-oxobutanoate hydroxymethyltransferase [Actinomycetota bacterium]